MIRTIAILLLAAGASWGAQEKPAKGKATGPEGYVLYSKALEGGYFVPKALLQEYEQLQSKLNQIKRRLDDGTISGKEAIAQAEVVRSSLRETFEKLEKAKKLVAAALVHRTEETMTFDLCPERLLVITANQVKIVGTDEAKVRVVVEKMFLSADDKSADADLAAIKVVHRRAYDSDVVGKTKLMLDAEEQQFLNKHFEQMKDKVIDGAALEFRRQIVESNRRAYAPYEAFQGKEFDHISLTGLAWNEGNRQMGLELHNADESASHYSVWQRHASMTVYVPRCKTLAVRGSRCGLDLQKVQANLVVTPDGESDRDYEAHFNIQGVQGNIRVVDFPINRIEDVKGDVRIEASEDFANSGTVHENSERFFRYFQMDDCVIRNVTGKLDARFGRVNLNLESISGGIELRNDHGDTTWIVKEQLPKALYRFRSVSGRLQVEADPKALGDLSVMLAGNYGSIRTNAPQAQYRDFSYGVGRGADNARSWHGFRLAGGKAEKQEFLDTLEILDVLSGKVQPKNGVMVINEAGPIVYRLNAVKK
jgi:hypothetical protein